MATASDVYSLGLILYELLCGKVYKSTGNAESWRQARPGRVRTEAHAANEVTDFLVGLFQDADLQQTRGRNVSARELLDQASTRLDAMPIAQAQVQARLLGTLGEIYISIGQPRRSIDLLGRDRAAVRARRRFAAISQGAQRGLPRLVGYPGLRACRDDLPRSAGAGDLLCGRSRASWR